MNFGVFWSYIRENSGRIWPWNIPHIIIIFIQIRKVDEMRTGTVHKYGHKLKYKLIILAENFGAELDREQLKELILVS